MFRVLKEVLTADQVARLRTQLATAQFDDGGLTAGPAARPAKRNLQANQQQADIAPARKLVTDALLRHEDFRIHALPLRMLPPLFSRYDPGMRYGAHTDNAIMGQDPAVRTDLALTLFLTPPADYDGGELTVSADGNLQSIKLPAGSAVVYPATTLHRVEPVTRGQRLAAVTWVQSVVRDQARRELLADLATALRAFQASAPGTTETLLLAKARANLMRMWAEV